MGSEGRERRQQRRQNRRDNYFFNDGTFFWEDQDTGFLGSGSNTETGTGREALKNFWNDITPWDTVYERQEMEDLLSGFDFEGAMSDAQDQASQMYGSTGQTAGEWGAQAADLNDQITGITEWMADQGLTMNDIAGETAGMQAIIDQLAAGPSAEDQDASFEYAARLMGMDADQVNDMIGNLSQQLSQGVNAAEGMSDQERALRERQNQANLREMESRAQRMVQNSLADTGSTVRMLASADEATRQINNVQLQQDAALAQEDFERKMAQFQSLQTQWGQMVQTNAMGSQQYLDQIQQGMSMAIEGYATKIDALLAENQQYFQMHQADMGAIQQQIDNLYKTANLQMGIDQAILDATDQLYAQNVQPYLDEVNMYLIAQENEGESYLEWNFNTAMDLLPIILQLTGAGGGG